MHGMDLFDPATSVVATALVNGLWQGLVLLGLVWTLLRIVEARRSLNATTRYAVWTVTLALIVALPVGAGMWAASLSQPASGASAETVVLLPDPEAAPVPAPGDAFSEEASVVAPVVAGVTEVPASPPVVVVDDAASATPVRSAPGWRLAIPRSMAPWLPFVFGAWLCVALALLARVAYSCVGVWRMKRHSMPLPPVYQRRLDAWRRAHGLRRPVRIGGVERLATPVAVGLWRPMILTPVSLLDHLTEEEFAQVMLHELAHVQRRDDWTNLFQKLAQAILFFHPAVHWIARQMEQEREMACDDWVVSLTQRPKAYASCLARLVELNVRSRGALVAPGMAVRKEHVFERVRRLLDQGRLVTARLSRAGFLTVVLALVAAVLLMARLAPFFAPPDPEAMERDEPVPVVLVEPHVAVSVEPRALIVAEPLVVSVDAEPLIVTGVETVLEPAGVALGVAPVRLLSSVTLADTLLTFRQVRFTGVQSVVTTLLQTQQALDQTQRTLEQNQTLLRPSGTPPQDLSVASWIRLLKASARIGSGGDKVRFLTDAVPRLPDDERVYAAYLETAETLGSSGDRKRALSALLDHHRLSNASMLRFLEAVQDISSDGDKAHLLIEVAPKLPAGEALREAYLDVAESISSSGDYRRVLSALTQSRR